MEISKHHGAGNDFLVLVDPDDRRPVTADEVRALCDRRRGIGADGFLRVVAPRDGADVGMELHNADGSTSEMSGNGIRCLVQAAVRSGIVVPGTVHVSTSAGIRVVEYREEPGCGLGFASVDMGAPRLGAEIASSELSRRVSANGGANSLPATSSDLAARLRPLLDRIRMARAVSTGNPHIVVMLDGLPPEHGLLYDVGRRLAASEAGGANVEMISLGPRRDELSMVVWERGVGETLACGTGSTAAAAAAHAWGEVGPRVVVHNLGGALEVELREASAILSGPTRWVACVNVDDGVLTELASS